MKAVIKLVAVVLLVLGMKANSASAGVAVPARVKLQCIDGQAVVTTISQYSTESAVINLSNGLSYTGYGYLAENGQGRLNVNSSVWVFFYNNGQLTVQFNTPGYAPGYGRCVLGEFPVHS